MINLDFISSDFLLYYDGITFSKSKSCLNKYRSARSMTTSRGKDSAGNWSYFWQRKSCSRFWRL